MISQFPSGREVPPKTQAYFWEPLPSSRVKVMRGCVRVRVFSEGNDPFRLV